MVVTPVSPATTARSCTSELLVRSQPLFHHQKQPDANDAADESAVLTWPEGVEPGKMAMPGDNIEMVCETYHPIAVENGTRFNIREGGRTVGTGLVTRVLE